jgi:pimeloyl-ACP methyl ester carboxylesterase
MTSARDYAVFSDHAYKRSTYPLPDGWVQYDDYEEPINLTTYYGIAFRNQDTGEVVIATRGTATTADLVQDLAIWLAETPGQFRAASHFVDQVKAKLAQDGHPADAIDFTGHSLGGYVAQLSAIREYAAGDTGVHATVFDSPGVELKTAESRSPIDIGFHGDPRDVDIVNYSAAPDLINTTNERDFGANVRVYPDYRTFDELGDPSGRASYYAFSLDQHHLSGTA